MATPGGKTPQRQQLTPFKKLVQAAKKFARSDRVSGLLGGLKKEAEISPLLHQECLAAIDRMQVTDPSLRERLRHAYGYVVFPRVGKASVVLGGAFGMGEVFEQGSMIGYSAIVQITLGLQLGGQVFHELVVFDDRQALNRFKRSRTSFAANASAVVLKAGAAASRAPEGATAFVQPEGGFGIDVAVGGQKFIFKPAALGRALDWLEPASDHIH